jgi:type IV pilus assembly protein PilB
MLTPLEKNISDTLLAKKLISSKDFEEAFEEKKRSGKTLTKVLVEQGYISNTQLFKFLSEQVGMEPIELKNKAPEPRALSLVDAASARLYRIIPLKVVGNTLDIAVADPFNPLVFDDLRFMLGMDIRGFIADEVEISETLDKFYGQKRESIDDIIKEMEGQSFASKFKEIDWQTIDISSLELMAKSGPVVKLLNLVLVQAIRDRASDIHFEPFEEEYKVRYRVDGALYEMVPPPKKLSLAISSRIKVMAGLNIAERRLPQDGRILIHLDGRDIELRVSTLPTSFGESVVMRVLDKTIVALDLGQIGLDPESEQTIKKLIKRPYGIIIVTGPTGAGKTTTLYSCLKIINTIDTKVITTEDPVEYDIEGIIQIGIKENIGLTFGRTLRHILRQDPDKIMVGEIRDVETAQMAVQASLTGHLVLTTLHTNDAPEAITRLIDMGVEPFLVTSTLEAVISQRLVRKICTACRQSFIPSQDVLATIGLNKNIIADKQFFYGKGCSVCNFTGYKGRTGIFEVLVINDQVRNLILERAPTVTVRQKSKELGMLSLKDSGLKKIFEGITTIEEVAKVT